MKLLIIFSVIMCGIAGATFVGLAQQKHSTELNQQAYMEGRAKAWGDRIPIATPTPSELHQNKETESSEAAGSIIAAMYALVIIPLGLFIYFLPSIIGRSKRNSSAIAVLNLFTGWSFIGWVIALVWACTQDSPAEAQS